MGAALGHHHPRLALRLRRVRRNRRPDAAQAPAGPLPALSRRPDPRNEPHHRRVAQPHERGGVPGARPRCPQELRAAGRDRRRAPRRLPRSPVLRGDRCPGRRGLGRPQAPARRAPRPDPALLSRHLARSLRRDLSQPRPLRVDRREQPRRARKADRQGPEIGPRHQRCRRRGVSREPDLPHRPLSRQGDGAEPAGPALCQHDLRAALERRRDRPRADHGGRDGRRRGARRLLRHLRRPARYGAKPYSPAPLPHGDGEPDLARRELRARREAEGAARP